MKEIIIISACLLGFNCKYNGGNNRLSDEKLRRLKNEYDLIPVCPECCGGLEMPRVPSERRGSIVVSKSGTDVTEQFNKGAQTALRLAQRFGVKSAILKERSPSCGSGKIYDGTFTGTVTDGDGVTAALLKAHGINITGESELPDS
jgi:uncharacterized protein YbbK (DUF523 family)